VPRYTKTDVGCYADGAHGHEYCRNRLASLLQAAKDALPSLALSTDLIASLQGDMSDDASEEYGALAILNGLCDHDVYFDFVNGDLLLVEVKA